MKPPPTRLAVMASGGGSNFEAIANHLGAEDNKAAVRICVVISDRAAAPVLEKARARGIATVHLKDHADGAELLAGLRQHNVELIALAGYLKLVPPDVVRAYAGKILNVHPGLLPRFGGPGMYGLRVHQAVIDAGERATGVTVHLVDEQYDHGATLAEWVVPVLKSDVAATLAARVLQAEHAFYPRVISAFAAGTVSAVNPMRHVNPADFPEMFIPWKNTIPQ